VQKIEDWLSSLDMSEYAQRFSENHIDVNVLRDLTDQDLKDLGVLSLGHRRKIMRAIAEHAYEISPSSPIPVVSAPSPRDGAERRQLTVMFTDLVGSTALSTRLDPEDLRSVIGAYHKCVAEAVARFDGFVAKYMGDGVLVYFGYPQAHEDDAERAVRVGLALVEAVPKCVTAANSPLQVRVGIATGLVVVGDLIGSGEAQERGIVGETPNLAARLQGIAEPNTVVISSSNLALVGSLFDYRNLGAVVLKGLTEAVPAWQVLGEGSVESRFDALRSRKTPLVGRTEEIELLRRRWRQVKSGQGRVVLLAGEPGIGKSRITVAIQEHLQDDPHTRLRYFCSPHHQDSALYPLKAQLERAAGFSRDDTAERKLDKVEALLAQSSARPEEIGYIADLLSIPNASRYPLPELSSQKCKERTLAALLAQVERMAMRHPVLAIYEDVHWIDPTTLELLALAIEQAQKVPLLLLITARPEFKQPWPNDAHVTNMTLGRIGRDEGASLIGQITGGKALPGEVVKQILAHTDGVPLFIEELTKTLVESGLLMDTGNQYMAAAPLPSLAIPTTLNASLLARLDRLAPEREVAQIGAALGRQFSHAIISAVAPMPQQQLDNALEQLVHAELIFRRGTPPDAEYTFKHALVQDAAYSTLLRSKRQELHTRIATVLEAQFPEIVKTQPDVLARHCGEAQLIEKAVGYLLDAGQQAFARHALIEAIAQLRKGLGLLTNVPDGGEKQQLELHLQTTLGRVLIATKGWSAPEPGEAFARARKLCEQLGRPEQLAPILEGQWAFRFTRGELAQAERHATELHLLGEEQNDVRWKCLGSSVRGHTCWFLGKFIDARTHHENALSLWDPKNPSFAVAPGGHAIILIYLRMALLCLGHINRAGLRRDQALVEARRSSPHTLASVLCLAWYGDWVVHGARTSRRMLQAAEEILTLSSEQGFPLWLGVGNILRGWCLASMKAPEGISLLLQGIAQVAATGCNAIFPFFLAASADVHRVAGQPQKGLELVSEAIKLIETTQERWAEAEILRVRGTLLLSTHEPAAAEDSYRYALEVARTQSAKFWELRAAIDLARIWHGQGNRTAARDLLEPIYLWFTEGLDTPVLQDAKALLNELA
jgi:class 3 adenylate cyclase/predicted ATPase